ncbi:hypothetical protein [Hoeflea sp.]|uniref:hypothetical protein n=1 Tax=Hoeflea sp. TaxID=1940281 RepID=UPI003B51C125
MADQPILFSGAMVLALLDGRKTQTRRVMNPQPEPDFILAEFTKDGFTMKPASLFGSPTHRMLRRLHRPGDRLWVRENWRTPESLDHLSPSEIADQCKEAGYIGPWCPRVTEADNLTHQWSEEDGFSESLPAGRLRASMHMPRWASRLTLKVTEVRVQRLQDISEDDAAAEGWPAPEDRAKEGLAEIRDAYPIGWFAHLWDSLNAARGFGWDANPWVSATSFEVIRGNIDEVKS